MQKYDFFIAGRWRNKDNVKAVLDMVRANGKTAYCFLENEYEGEVVEPSMDGNPEEFMLDLENLSQDHPLIHKIFEMDIIAQRQSDNFLVVLPAGNAAHIEMGASYGMGKKCYAVGKTDKTESLYCLFDEIFPDADALQAWLAKP